MKIASMAILGLVLFAGGCVSVAEQRMLDEERCRNYGFRQANDAFASCLLELDLDRSATMRQRLDSGFGPGPFYYGRRW